MEVAPSPNSVGTEFVKVYYTLLNEAPHFLHRFYSNKSSFLHSDDNTCDDEPVVGQSEIHKKIMSLNFKDCRAKILCVDCQPTLATGVVVQVTGELSNNGQPLRRFMQTFVLAPQKTNQYYVHNDIFRYQDEVFRDIDADETEENCEPEQQQPVAVTTSAQHQVASEADESTSQDSFYQSSSNAAPRNESTINQHLADPQPPLTNGHRPAHLGGASGDHLATIGGQIESATDSLPQTEGTDQQSDINIQTATAADDGILSQAPLSPGSHSMSWARMVDQSERMAATTPQSTTHTNSSGTSEFPPSDQSNLLTGNNGPENSLTKGFGDMKLNHMTDSGISGMGRGDERRPERIRHPDSHQVFVGNLPHSITESELISVFKDYGVVLEVRINKMSANKVPFGFVTFEDEIAAQKVLTMRTIDCGGQKLNIERKNTRSSSGPRHGGSSSYGGGRRDNQRYHRGGGGSSGGRGGFGGGPRDEGRNRSDQGRFYSNKSHTAYQQH